MGKKRSGGVVRGKQANPKLPSSLSSLMKNPMEELLQIPDDEMIHLPPPPNRRYQVFWPLHESFTMQTDSFQVIYPNYLDSTKTIQQGRRIAAHFAIPVPTITDISQALQQLGVRHVMQPYKGYSRDVSSVWDNPGRCLVDLSLFRNKKQLVLRTALQIGELPDRAVRLAQYAEQRAEQEQTRAAAAIANTSDPAKTTKKTLTGASTGNKKKNKGHKRK